MQFGQQFHALTVEVDVALEFLVDAVYLYVIDEGGDFALLKSLVEERERLLQELDVAVVDDLLKALQLLVVGGPSAGHRPQKALQLLVVGAH